MPLCLQERVSLVELAWLLRSGGDAPSHEHVLKAHVRADRTAGDLGTISSARGRGALTAYTE
jgi:hypothetical protein